MFYFDIFQFDDGGEFTDDDAYGHGPVAFSSRFYATWYYYMGLVSKFVISFDWTLLHEIRI